MVFFNPVIPTYKPTDPVIPRSILGIPSPARAHTFNPESRRDFALKSWIPSFNEGKTRILKSLMESIKLNQTSLFVAWLFHTDCVLYVYLCNGIKFLELANPNTQNLRTLFMNKIMIRQNLWTVKYKNPSQTMTYIYDKPNFKERKIFLKDNESENK